MRFLIVLGVAMLYATPVVAQNSASDKLSAYNKEANPTAAGMCDASRNVFIRFAGKTYKEMVIFFPSSKSQKVFYVVTTALEKEYFIEDRDLRAVRLLPTAMEWSEELMPESMNFFRYLFFPDREHDCSESPIKK
jgi:hypothetical protein